MNLCTFQTCLVLVGLISFSSAQEAGKYVFELLTKNSECTRSGLQLFFTLY